MRILAIITFAFLLFGCRKSRPEFDGVNCTGDCYVLTGRVVDTPSTAGLNGVELKFYYRLPGYSLFTNPNRYLGKAFTNSNGDYSFRFDGRNYKDAPGYFQIKATKRDYFFDPIDQNTINTFYLDSSLFNQPVVQNFALFRPATLTVRFKATNANFEFLTFTYSYGNTGTGIILNGKRAIDTTITYKTAGDIRTFIQWDALGNGVNIQRFDTLFAKRGENIRYQVDL